MNIRAGLCTLLATAGFPVAAMADYSIIDEDSGKLDLYFDAVLVAFPGKDSYFGASESFNGLGAEAQPCRGLGNK